MPEGTIKRIKIASKKYDTPSWAVVVDMLIYTKTKVKNETKHNECQIWRKQIFNSPSNQNLLDGSQGKV